MLVLTAQFSMHVYDFDLLITCAYLCMLLGIRHTTRWGVLTPLDSHVQISKFGACGFFSC